MSLRTRGLDFSYGAEPFLEAVDLALDPGRILGIAGPNGAGKTTLLNLLAGLLSPVAGEVLWNGRPILSYPRAEIARGLALIPAETRAPFAYTVREVVEMGRYPHSDPFRPLGAADAEAVARALAATHLAGWEDRVYNNLSSGERQRVVIARALAQTPRVLLLDEPTVHLDLRYQTSLEGILAAQRADGVAVAWITHDLNQAARACDTLVLMEHGRIVAHGAPSSVLDAATLTRIFRTPLEVHPHPRTGAPTVWPA